MMNKKKTSEATALTLIVMLLISSLLSNVVASVVSLTVNTDKARYFTGETVYISGKAMINGNPLRDTYVYITVRDPDTETIYNGGAVTNRYGFYAVNFGLGSGAPIGTYNVTARTPQILTGNVSAPEAKVFKTFEVVAHATERVIITINGSGPISGANVILYDHLSGGWMNNAVTNSSGMVVLDVTTNVKFDVVVYKIGYGSIVDGKTLGVLFADNATNGYNSPANLSFVLTSVSYGTLRGTVVNDTDNTPLGDVMVSLLFNFRSKTYWVDSTTTLSNGSYTTPLNIGLWKIWVDRKVDGNVTHLGTWSEVLMTANANKTLNVSLWPKAQLRIVDLSPEESHYEIVLVNDTYGGALWRWDISSPVQFPVTADIPAVNGMILIHHPDPCLQHHN